MEPEPQQPSEISSISWHTAFMGAIQFELEEYKDALEFHSELQLTSEPLRIDCVIIKKIKDVVIKKNIAAIFREHNLLEYKSPDDYVSVSDFYKVYGYACLYASLQKVSINNLTVSFVESHYPEKLIKHLWEERNYRVEESGPGIYSVKGDILPIQVIDSRRLSVEENLWLRGLDNRVSIAEYLKIEEKAGGLGKEDLSRLQAYLYALAQANPKTIQEAVEMSDGALTLEKVLEDAGWTARWEARGRAKGRTEGRTEGRAEGRAEGQKKLIALLKNGKTIEEVEKILGLNVK